MRLPVLDPAPGFDLGRREAPPPRPRLHLALRPLAWLLRRAAVAIALVAMTQRPLLRALGRTQWRLSGSCRSCGRCCDNLLLPAAPSSRPWVASVRRFWHEQVFDFYPKPMQLEHGSDQFLAYGCRNLTADRRCARYALRPLICRAYPALALYSTPAPKPHCGYSVSERR